MYTTLLTERSDRILLITLNRPDALNALNIKLLEELREVIQQSYDDPEVAGLIITGSGEKAFAAGADIKEISEIEPLNARKFAENGQEIFSLIENHHKPVIAAVNGFALGGGCELAMACHLRLATPNARFGQPEAKLGLIPGYGGTQRLTRLIGSSRALELMMTCDMIQAGEAQASGLVNYVLEDRESMMDKAREILGKIFKVAPRAVASIIEASNACHQDGLDGYQVEANLFGSCIRTEDFLEGVEAFIEKREPKFRGN